MLVVAFLGPNVRLYYLERRGSMGTTTHFFLFVTPKRLWTESDRSRWPQGAQRRVFVGNILALCRDLGRRSFSLAFPKFRCFGATRAITGTPSDASASGRHTSTILGEFLRSTRPRYGPGRCLRSRRQWGDRTHPRLRIRRPARTSFCDSAAISGFSRFPNRERTPSLITIRLWRNDNETAESTVNTGTATSKRALWIPGTSPEHGTGSAPIGMGGQTTPGLSGAVPARSGANVIGNSRRREMPSHVRQRSVRIFDREPGGASLRRARTVCLGPPSVTRLLKRSHRLEGHGQGGENSQLRRIPEPTARFGTITVCRPADLPSS